MMLPPDIRDWIPKDYIVHFIIKAVSLMELKGFTVNTRNTRSEQYSPKMMLILLIYCYEKANTEHEEKLEKRKNNE